MFRIRREGMAPMRLILAGASFALLTCILPHSAAAQALFPGQFHATGTYPNAMAAGDFNDDGIGDLAVLSFGLNRVGIQLGNGIPGTGGDGTFRSGQSFAVGKEPWDVVAADITGDDVLDLIIAESFGGSVEFWAGDAPGGTPDGTFTRLGQVIAGNYPVALVTADFDEDTDTDLAVADYWGDRILVFLNEGAGTFPPAVEYPCGNRPIDLLVDDFTDDGVPDLVSVNFLSDDLTSYVGAGDGSFGFREETYAGPRPISASSAAVGASDDVPDVAVTNFYVNRFRLIHADPGGFSTFEPQEFDNLTVVSPRLVRFDDVNNDTRPDLIIMGEEEGQVEIRLGTPSESFTAAVRYHLGSRPLAIEIFDATSDGIRDVVAALHWQHAITVLNGLDDGGVPTGGFAPQRFAVSPGPQAVAAADLDGDGLPELISANNGSTVTVRRGLFNPDMIFDFGRQTAGEGDPSRMFIASMNEVTGGDTLPDILVLDRESNILSVYQSDPELGEMIRPALLYTVGQDPADMVGIDVDDDGDTDVLIAEFGDGTVSALLHVPGESVGANSFGRRIAFDISLGADPNVDLTLTGSAGSALGSSCAGDADFNGDGVADFVVGLPDVGAGQVEVYFGGLGVDDTADLTLSGEAAGDAFGFAVALAGDFDGDGSVDLLVGAPGNDGAGTDAGRAYLYYGGSSADNVADLVMDGLVAGDGFGSSVSAAGDFSEDGSDDFIVGAPGHDDTGANLEDVGAAYIYFGLGDTPNTGDGVADIELFGIEEGDAFGSSVASAGDFNADGPSDVIVGAPGVGSDDHGAAYVFYGGEDANTLFNVSLNGEAANDRFGTAVALAGDVDSGTNSDVIVGAPFNDEGGADAGRAYVFYGTPNGDTEADLTFTGQSPGDLLGSSVAGNGDLKNDRFDDVIVGAPGNGAGVSYVFYGGLAADEIADVVLPGVAADDEMGSAVAFAGDVNLDGFDDLLSGAAANSNGGGNAGQAYLYFGGPGPKEGVRSLAAGDFNGDARLDVAVVNLLTDELFIALGDPGFLFLNPGAVANSVISVGSGPVAVVTAEINGDSNLDLMVLLQGDQALEVYLGNGDGSFTLDGSYLVGPQIVGYDLMPEQMAVADVTGDSELDAVIALRSAGAVAVLPGNGDGSFGDALLFGTGRDISSVFLYDLDADGSLDVLSADTVANLVSVLFSDLGFGSSTAVVTGSQDGSIRLPNLPLLAQNYPNPFNPRTNIRFDLPLDSRARIEVFDSRGRRVVKLLDESLESGSYNVVWDASDESGGKVAAGVYFYRLVIDGQVAGQHKMVLAK